MDNNKGVLKWKYLHQQHHQITQCLKDIIIALHDAERYATSKGEGYKQDCIATNNMIGKIFLFFNNTFLLHI